MKVREPKVFLMDEPLSNLDAKLRVQMRTEISKLHQRLQTTFIYVTHDQVEAMTMGTRIVVMKDGIVQQVDSPQEISNNPANIFVAGFIGSPQMNFIDGTIKEEGGKYFACFQSEKIEMPMDKARLLKEKGYIGKNVIIGVRPEHLDDDQELVAANPTTVIKSKVEVTELMGAESYIYTKLGDQNITVRVNGSTKLQNGQEAKFYVDANKIHIFDKETELKLV